MPEFLLEIRSEEIPARMQAQAEKTLQADLASALEEAGLAHGEMETFSTPRRLGAVIRDMAKGTPDTSEERRGPRADAPDKAVKGFKDSLPEGTEVYEKETDKGTFLFAKVEEKGRPAAEVLAEMLPGLIHGFSWPKSMRWGAGDVRWVRPIRSILCLYGGEVVPFEVDGIAAGNVTYGRRGDGEARLRYPNLIEISDYENYQDLMSAARVAHTRPARLGQMYAGFDRVRDETGLAVRKDEGLLQEVIGLVEWAEPLVGEFDARYLDLPVEVLVAEMRNHQKYFALEDDKGNITNRFVITAQSGGDAEVIIAGNERVLAARFEDARFFWDQDRKTKLDDNLKALSDIVFHEKLGTLADKVERIEKLAGALAQHIPGCDAKKAKRAAKLAKADLVSGMVGEFPELQGIMGGYYAAEQGEDEAVACAICDHYRPQGPGDACPDAPETIAVALADKIDTLTGFFAIGETPTGSRDPFALRRAALGVIRLIVENELRLNLIQIFKRAGAGKEDATNLMDFLAERLKVQQREAGVRHDLIDAVYATGTDGDLVRVLARVRALQDFLATDDGENLLAGYKRAANIVRIEEKKDKHTYNGAVDKGRLKEAQEKALYKALVKAEQDAKLALDEEDFKTAMAAIAKLRKPIDDFFDHVTVNAEDAKVRENRLNLLSDITTSLNGIADFSKIES